MTANDQPASDQHGQAAEHHAEPYTPPPAPPAEPPYTPPPAPPAEPPYTPPAAHSLDAAAGGFVGSLSDVERERVADNCGDPECPCDPPARCDDPAGYAAAPTVEPDQERAPRRRRRRRRYDPAAVLAVMLAGVQVGRAVRNLVETIRVVQESGGLM